MNTARSNKMTTIQNVTIYLADGEWCYAAWTGDIGAAGCFDHSDDSIASTEADARAEILGMWPEAQVVLVAEVRA